LNAAEAIFEYATRGLGFKEEDIILYGWSIGGYPASYLASQHPRVKGLVSTIFSSSDWRGSIDYKY